VGSCQRGEELAQTVTLQTYARCLALVASELYPAGLLVKLHYHPTIVQPGGAMTLYLGLDIGPPGFSLVADLGKGFPKIASTWSKVNLICFFEAG